MGEADCPDRMSPEAKLLYPITGAHVGAQDDKTQPQTEALEELAESCERKSPAQLSAEELFYSLYKTQKSYSDLLSGMSAMLNHAAEKTTPREELMKRNIVTAVFKGNLMILHLASLYEEVAKRLGLTDEQMARATNLAYSKKF